MIKAITMPKWGLSMTEGLVGDWLVAEGAAVQSGTEVVLVETEKIAGGVEVAGAGTVRRAVAATGDTLPVGALLGVLADGPKRPTRTSTPSSRSSRTTSYPRRPAPKRASTRPNRSRSANCRSTTCGRATPPRPRSCCTASAATSTTGCSISRR